MDALLGGSGIILAILGLGFLIFIHELGHFLFAKWAGVKVETFSIGFGPVVWSRRIGDTEYALSLLPFGGFVAMREEPDGSGRSFAEASASWRGLILIGGVLFNLIGSYLLLLGLAWTGLPMVPARVGGVEPQVIDSDGHPVDNPIAAIGLRTGDRIVRYNDTHIRSYEDLVGMVVTRGDEPVQLIIERDGATLALPESGPAPRPAYSGLHGRPVLGINQPSGTLLRAVAGTPALEPGERVVAVAGQAVASRIGEEVSDLLLPYVGREVALTVADEDGGEREATLRYAGSRPEQHAAGVLGLPVVVKRVMAGMPAAEVGVEVGDVLVAIDDVAVVSAEHLRALVARAADAGRPVALEVLRPGLGRQRFTLEPRLDPVGGRQLIGVEMASRERGRIDHFAPGFDGSPSPLAAAGMVAGDVLVAVTNGDGLHAYALRGGGDVVLSFNADERRALSRIDDPPALAKMFGAVTRSAVIAGLPGRRVVTVTAEQLALATVTEAAEAVDLTRLPPALAARLATELHVGDWIIDVHYGSDDTVALMVVRDGPAEPLVLEVARQDAGTAFAFAVEAPPYRLEAWHEAFALAGTQCWDMLTLTGRVVGRFFKSSDEGGVEVSKSLAGPVGLFSALKANVEAGAPAFLKLLAILGLNLVIINLLPIPIADGGRLLLLLIEVVIRRPVPSRVEGLLNSIGLVFIIGLMLFILGVDILRLLGRH
ncbi:MAG: site-2 protease family protein [Planctomycetota bacterium]|jgi:membrane-associated protease RseP (regulator of RpoE activity)